MDQKNEGSWADLVETVPWRYLSQFDRYPGRKKSSQSNSRRGTWFQYEPGIWFEGHHISPVFVISPGQYDRRYELDMGGTRDKPGLSVYLEGVPNPAALWTTSTREQKDESLKRMRTMYIAGLYPGRFTSSAITGNVLLRLLDHIATVSHLETYSLSDESCVEYTFPGLTIVWTLSLARYGLLMTGQTWYERHGFLPTADNKELALKCAAVARTVRREFLHLPITLTQLHGHLEEMVDDLSMLLHHGADCANLLVRERRQTRLESCKWLLSQHGLWHETAKSKRKRELVTSKTVEELLLWVVGKDQLKTASRSQRNRLLGFDILWDLCSEQFPAIAAYDDTLEMTMYLSPK